MTTNKFEIRVAVIGYVSVGKTTLINALFGAEYGEVSMRRTTAVVNSYRLDQADKENEWESVDKSTQQVVETAAVALEASVKDNQANRDSEGAVKEKIYNVRLQEALHNMRDDSKLVVVDIPGINEVGTSSKDYVMEHWHTFDIAVVVMDGRQGVNTEEQLDLLKLAKENSESTKNIPVIVIFNKIDDPEDEEQVSLLNESRRAVEGLFDVTDRQKALEDLLVEAKEGDDAAPIKSTFFPCVIPMSAMHAFLYRAGSRLTVDEFAQMDTDFVEKIGKESYGRQWRSFSAEKKLEKAFESVSDESQRQDGLKASNFDAFIQALSYCMGGEARQASTIRKQVDIAADRISKAGTDCDLLEELLAAYTKLTALGSSTTHLPDSFWLAFDKVKAESLASFDTQLSPVVLERPFNILASFVGKLGDMGWQDQTKQTTKKAKDLALHYVASVLNHEKDLEKTPGNFRLILGSLLLLASNSTFCSVFGALKIGLEMRFTEATVKPLLFNMKCKGCDKILDFDCPYDGSCFCCPDCNLYSTKDGSLPTHCLFCTSSSTLPPPKKKNRNNQEYLSFPCGHDFSIPFTYSRPVKVKNGRLVFEGTNIVIPDSIEDPSHFGHPLFKCCQILEAIEELEE